MVSASESCASNTTTVPFSETLNPATAAEASSYQLSGGIAVQSALLAPDGRTVEFVTEPLTAGVSFTLTVDSVQDLAGNTIAPDSQRNFACPIPAAS